MSAHASISATAVQPSSNTNTSGLPAYHGLDGDHHPVFNLIPWPASPKFGTPDLRACGCRCRGPQNPVPPKILRPRPRFCTAKPTSPSIAPGLTTSIPAFRDASVAFSSRTASVVDLAHRNRDGRIAVVSVHKCPKIHRNDLPVLKHPLGEGMPCTTSLLTEVHNAHGYPW